MAEELKEKVEEQPVEVAAVETVAEEPAPVEEPAAEAAPEKKPRELFFERVRTNMPEGKYDEDEEEYFRNAGSLMDKWQKGDEMYRGLSEKLQARFNESPEDAAAILDYLDGKPLIAAIVENMGEDALTMREGMEGWDDFVAARDARKKRFGESEELIKKLQENAALSEKNFEEFAAENNLSDDDKQELLDVLTGDVNATNMGDWGKDLLMRYLHSLRYAKDVEAAREQGRIDGRNERIKAERKDMKGSGLPSTAAGGNAQTEVDTPMSDTEKFLAGIKRR